MAEAFPTTILSLPNGHFLFTASSASEGHPDKVCDQVADAILDACLAQDPNSKFLCDVCIKGQVLFVLGELVTNAQVEVEQVVRETIKRIGFDSEEKGMDYVSCRVIVQMTKRQSTDWQGIGDHGVCVGFASSETAEGVPLTQSLASKLAQRLTEVRRNGLCTWVRPDGRTQLTLEYKHDQGKLVAVRVHALLISVQQDPEMSLEELRLQLKEHVVKPVIPAQLLDEHTLYYLNPNGKFLIGREVGVSGRRIETFSGWTSTATSTTGRDPCQVVRCGSFAARWAAKSLVKAHLCDRVQIQLAYAGGALVSAALDTFGTSKVGKDDHELLALVLRNFDLRPDSLLRDLKLQRPIYQKAATLGHFGREDDFDFTSAFYVDLAPNDRLCFSEELSQQTLMVGEVTLVGVNTPPTLTVQVFDTVNTELFRKESVNYAKFSFTSLDAGVHQFCLGNTAGQPVELDFDIRIGIEAKDYTNIASTKDLKPTELAIQRMKDRTAQIHKEVQYLREREEQMRNTNVTIHNRVIGYSICTLLFLLVLALVQIVYLRRVFRAKKVI